MKRFVGLDVSQATMAICVVDADGKTLAEGVTATEPGTIVSSQRRRVRPGRRAARMALGLGRVDQLHLQPPGRGGIKQPLAQAPIDHAGATTWSPGRSAWN